MFKDRRVPVLVQKSGISSAPILAAFNVNPAEHTASRIAFTRGELKKVIGAQRPKDGASLVLWGGGALKVIIARLMLFAVDSDWTGRLPACNLSHGQVGEQKRNIHARTLSSRP